MKNTAPYIKYTLASLMLVAIAFLSFNTRSPTAAKKKPRQLTKGFTRRKAPVRKMTVDDLSVREKKAHRAKLHSGCSCSHCQGEGPLVKPVVTRLTGVKLKDIPESRFKTEVLALSSEFQLKALDKLTSINFQGEDLESLHCDYKGGVYFSCNFTGPEGIDESEAVVEKSSFETSEAALPISTPPAYHSKAGATNVIFLDFNGGKVAGTIWNKDENVKEWDCKPFDADGDATTFSDAEQRYIRLIWERVSEDYSSFDVDVTTEQPKVWTTTTGHAMITPGTDKNGVALPHVKSGGVAYVGVFGNPDYSYNRAECHSPAWVKVMGSAASGYANTAEAAAHEIGHNMGLKHDTTKVNAGGYYGGHGNGSISWAPLMGTGYGANISQWSKGEYYDFFNSEGAQDDIAIIAGRLTYRVDEGGSTNGTAASLVTTNGSVVKQAGIIAESGDIDVYSFVSGAGDVNFKATAYRAELGTWGSNLDVELQLQDSAGKVLVTNNPVADNNAAVSYKLPTEGTYYLHVKPVGVGKPFNNPPSGYTVYGSVGQYTLTGRIIPADGLVVQAPNGGESYYQGHTYSLTWVSALGGNVKIELLKAGKLVKLLTASTENDGSFDWAIPSGQQIGSDYSLRITSLSSGAKLDSSDANFSIVSFFPYAENFEKGIGQWVQSKSDNGDWRSVTGSSGLWRGWSFAGVKKGPSGAQSGSYYLNAEDLHTGNQSLVLESEFSFSTVRDPQLSFYYHMYGFYSRHFTVGISTDGGTNWTNLWEKNGDQGDGWKKATIDLTNYGGAPHAKIRFTYLSYKPSSIGLDSISITAKNAFPSGTVAVLSPNGGESYRSGSVHEIRWGTSDLPGKVKVELYRDGGFDSTIVSQTDNDGSYSWSIPNNLSGAGLTVKVTSLEAGAATDVSNAAFSIVGTIYNADMSVNPGWDLGSGWAYGKPAGAGGDPAAGYTGNNVIGYNLSGPYAQLAATVWATTKKIDCSKYSNVKLSFRRWLGIETSKYDHAYVQVSNNNKDWTILWENPTSLTKEEAWSYQELDISSVADGEATVYIRWGMGKADKYYFFSGWNIDDVEVKGSQKAPSNFNVTAVAGAHGSVTPKSQVVGKGESSTGITATANVGYHFTGWSGDATGTTNPLTFSNVTAGKTVTANFAINTYSVTFNLDGKGTRSGGGVLRQTINYGQSATAPTVTGHSGWDFEGWNVAFNNIVGNLAVTAQYNNMVDSNKDGLWDSLQRKIAGADTTDSINNWQDVKGSDDFDQDGISNLDEQKNGSDPITFDKELYPGWNLLHYPRSVTGEANSTSLRFSGKKGDVYQWSPASDDYSSTTSLKVGSAVWVLWKVRETIQMPGSLVKAHSVTLESGWNMVGTPFAAQKITSGKIAESIWHWSPVNQKYELLTGALDPGTGYWIYALEPVTLSLQAK